MLLGLVCSCGTRQRERVMFARKAAWQSVTTKHIRRSERNVRVLCALGVAAAADTLDDPPVFRSRDGVLTDRQSHSKDCRCTRRRMTSRRIVELFLSMIFKVKFKGHSLTLKRSSARST